GGASERPSGPAYVAPGAPSNDDLTSRRASASYARAPNVRLSTATATKPAFAISLTTSRRYARDDPIPCCTMIAGYPAAGIGASGTATVTQIFCVGVVALAMILPPGSRLNVAWSRIP